MAKVSQDEAGRGGRDPPWKVLEAMVRNLG